MYMNINDNITIIKKINDVLDELDIPLATKRKLKKILIQIAFACLSVVVSLIIIAYINP